MVKIHGCKMCHYPTSKEPNPPIGHKKRAEGYKDLCEDCAKRIIRGDIGNDSTPQEEV